MTTENATTPTVNRPLLLSPWVAGLGALIIYALTLNGWATFNSLGLVAQITGWDWHPQYLPWRPSYIAPLYSGLTLPFRFLPPSLIPIALNFFSAVCAAASLGLLAASVRLMPHDRTREQRQREPGDYALLSLRESWLPPLLAVLACGLQLTFWEHATSASVEMLDLLIFAWLIFCLLKSRVSSTERWLNAFVLSYGIGTCNNWALIGFFPCFLVALVWIKGRAFFRWGLLLRLTVLGLAGLSMYLAAALIASFANPELGFFELLRAHVGQQKYLLMLMPRWAALLLAFPTLVALLFIGVCWPSFFGEMSAAGNAFNNALFRLIHIAFFGFGVWFFFDYKFSPRVLSPGIGFLSFYYMAALSVGYFSGYLLLVCKRPPVFLWRPPTVLSKLGNRALLAAVWFCLLAVPTGLASKNLPKIQEARGHALRTFATEMLSCIPQVPSVILSDHRDLLYLLQAACERSGKQQNYILLETGSLSHREYLLNLRARHPEFQKMVSKPEMLPEQVDPASVTQILLSLAGQRPIYYLHPSFGYFFEHFYPKARGLVYELRPARRGILDSPQLNADEISKNQVFWDRLTASLGFLKKDATQQASDPQMVALLCSRGLNDWGVQLQRHNQLSKAEAQFKKALEFNPRNIVAEINKQYNSNLRKGLLGPLPPSERIAKEVRQYRSWDALLTALGPVDEPAINQEIGMLMLQGQNPYQAAALFQRNLQLCSTNLDAQLGVAKVAAALGMPDKVLELLQQIRATPGSKNLFAYTELEALAWLQKRNFSKAEQLFQSALKDNPKDRHRLSVVVHFYRSAGYAASQAGEIEKANKMLRTALGYIEQQLELPRTNPTGGAEEQIDVLQGKAEIHMQLKEYDQAASTLTKALDMQPANDGVLANRAVVQLMARNFEGAKRDYLTLRKRLPSTAYSIYYGLGEIAFQQNKKSDAVENYRLYLKYAPKTAPEYKTIAERLHQLERGS